MQKNKWSRKFDWIKSTNASGTTIYTQQDRLEKYSQDRFIPVDSIYFKFNKYLDGVCFSYINNLNNIYKRDLLTGDGYSIFNMYNEYDVVDRVTKNWLNVDIASNVNVNLNQQYVKIDGITLLPGHLVLLFNQDSEFENDVYIVNNQSFLENGNFLSDNTKSDKFVCNVKLGSNADKQFYLVNNGFEFPTIFEPKYFIEGKSIILKNKVKYDLFSNSSKIIFTDYDFAKKQYEDTYTLFDSVLLNSTISDVRLKYHHDEYIIRIDAIDINQVTGLTVSNISGSSLGTIIPFSTLSFNEHDYIQIKMFSGSTEVLSMKSFVKTGLTSTLIIEEVIPVNVLRDLKYCTYDIRNLNLATNWDDVLDSLLLDNTTYSDFYDYYAETGSTSIAFYPKQSKFNKYFDYDGLYFSIDGGANYYNFLSNTSYLRYTLYDILNKINSTIFTVGFTGITNSSILSDITATEYINTNSYTSKIIISSNTSGLTNIFTPYTYVDIEADSLTGRTLIYSVDEYSLTIEKPHYPITWPSVNPNITKISNIDGLEKISNILQEVYINEDYEWYIEKSDNERKYICKAYGELLTLNASFRDNITGILYENENNEFILKLYDLETDTNLEFTTVEIMFLGADKKTRLPVPYKRIVANTNLMRAIGKTTTTETEETYWNVLDGTWTSGVTYDPYYISSPETSEFYDFGFNNVLSPPNEPPTLYNTIDGNLMSS